MVGTDPLEADNPPAAAVSRPAGWTWPITHHHLNTMRAVLDNARAGDLTADWRNSLTAPTPPTPADADIAAQALDDLRALPAAPWEPNTAGGDWRAALDAWYLARREIIDAATDLNDSIRRSQRATLRRIRNTTMSTPPQVRMPSLVQLEKSGSPGALLRRGPLRTQRAGCPALGSSKPRGRCGFRSPASASLQAAVAGGVYQAGPVPVQRAASPVVGEVVGGDRPFPACQGELSPLVQSKPA
jgi:hypothetical protein